MNIDVYYLGKLPFYGDRVRAVLQRLGGQAIRFHPVPTDKATLNETLRALRGRGADALLICPIAPVSMLPEVSPAAVELALDMVGLLSEFRQKLKNQNVPTLCPLAGKAFSDPSMEVTGLRAQGIENAMVVLAPNLIGAQDIIRDPRYRIAQPEAESALRGLLAGDLCGRPATSMADFLRHQQS